MKKKRFFVLGLIGMLGIPILFGVLLYEIITLSIKLNQAQSWFFYVWYSIIIILMFFYIILLPKSLQFVIFNNSGITVRNLFSKIIFIAWNDVKDFAVITASALKFLNWVYISTERLTDNEKNPNTFQIGNKKNSSIIKFMYNKKAYKIIKGRLENQNT